jgi:non-ribosomal peptide synthetase component F
VKWSQEEVMARSPRSLDDLKTSIEESMAEALQQREPDVEAAPDVERAPVETIPAADTNTRTDQRTDADQLAQTCDRTAEEIQATGEAVMQVAHSIAAETQALAELLRKHGAAIAARIEEFSAMSKRVSEKLNAARADVLGANGAPSITPQLERDEKK